MKIYYKFLFICFILLNSLFFLSCGKKEETKSSKPSDKALLESELKKKLLEKKANADIHKKDKLTTDTITLSGSIVDNSNNPIPNSSIYVYENTKVFPYLNTLFPSIYSNKATYVINTDAIGKFHYSNIPLGNYNIMVKPTNSSSSLLWQYTISLKPTIQPNEYLLKMVELSDFKCTIINNLSQPIQDVFIYVCGDSDDWKFFTKVKSNKMGEVKLNKIPYTENIIIYAYHKDFGYAILTGSDILPGFTENGLNLTLQIEKPKKILNFDEEGKPVSKISIQQIITSNSFFKDASIIREKINAEFAIDNFETDKDGQCILLPSPENHTKLFISKDGYIPKAAFIAELIPSEQNIFSVKINKARNPLTLNMVDENDNPISDVYAYSNFSGILSKLLVSDKDGTILFNNLPFKDYSITVLSQGYTPQVIVNINKDEKNKKITLLKGVSINGLVADIETEREIVNAKLTLTQKTLIYPSDIKGNYQINFISAAEKKLTASAKNYALENVDISDMDTSTVISNLKILLSKGKTIAGGVYRKNDATPIIGAKVSALFYDNSTISDSDGKFSIKNLPNEKIMLFVEADGYVSEKRTFDISNSTEFIKADFYLVDDCYIEGIIINEEQKPIKAADVYTSEEKFAGIEFPVENINKTDVNGVFKITNIKPNTEFSIIASHQDYASAKIGAFVLKPGENKKDIKIMLMQGGKISGRVINTKRQPLENANVSIAEKRSSSNMFMNLMSAGRILESKNKQLTDKDGKFIFNHITPGTYSIAAKNNGYIHEIKNGIIIQNNKEVSGIEFILNTESKFNGHVLNKERKPVENAHISAVKLDLQNMFPGTANTDKKGFFEIHGLSDGSHTVVIMKDNYQMYQKNGFVIPAENAEFIISEGGKIEGKVIDEKTNSPVKSFTLTPKKSSLSSMLMKNLVPDQDFMKAKSFDDKNGKFIMGGLEPGNYSLRVSAVGYSPILLQGIDVKEGKSANVVAKLNKGFSLTGKIISASDKKPIPAAFIQLNYEKNSFQKLINDMDIPKNSQTTYSNDKGEFQIDNLSAENIFLSISKENFQQEDRTFTISEDSQKNIIEIEMKNGGAIKGIVVGEKSEEPINNCKIYREESGLLSNMLPELMLDSVITNEKGEFNYQNIPAGKHSFKIICEGYSTKLLENIELKEGEIKDLGIIKLTGGSEIFGIVYGLKYKPVEGISVFTNGPSGLKFAKTNEDGMYTIKELCPGNYSLSISDLQNFFGTSKPQNIQEKSVYLKENESLEVNFFIEPGLKIHGRVIEGDKPVTDVVVFYQDLDFGSDERSSGMIKVDQKGEFTFEDVIPGHYIVAAISESYMNQPNSSPLAKTEIFVEDKDIETELIIPLGSISGYVRDSKTKKLILNAEITIIPSEFSLTLEDITRSYLSDMKKGITEFNGLYQIKNISAGDYSVIAKHEKYSYAVKDISIKSGETLSNIDFELTSGFILKGKAIDKISINPLNNLYLDIRDKDGKIVLSEDVKIDSLGNYIVEGLNKGEYRINAFSKGYAPMYNIVSTISDSQENILDLQFSTGGSLNIIVINEAGEPIEKAKVDILDTDGWRIQYPFNFDTLLNFRNIIYTDKEGRLIRKNLPAGQYNLNITATGYVKTQTSIEIIEENETSLSVKMTK